MPLEKIIMSKFIISNPNVSTTNILIKTLGFINLHQSMAYIL